MTSGLSMNDISKMFRRQFSKELLLIVFGFVIFGIPGIVEAANESPQTYTLDGTLFKVGTKSPLEDASAKLTIQIISADGKCLLYEEQQFVNTSLTKGYFSIQVGSSQASTKRTVNDPGRTMTQIFQNMFAIAANSVPGETCTGGTFAPAAGEVRYFRVYVTPSVTNVADRLTPDIVIDSVPQAHVAQSVQGLERANILQANTAGGVSLNQSNLEGLFTGSAYANLQQILGGNFLTSSNISGDNIISGTISGSTSIATSGNLITTGTVSGQTVQGSQLRVYSGANYAQLSAGTISANLNFTLPNGYGSSGQVITTDGSGAMVWSNLVDVNTTANPISSGATVDLALSNTHTLASVGGTVIGLSGQKDGSVYNIVIEDTTSRTYTFTGCTNSYFKPANGPTTAATRTIYGIMTVKKGSNWDCYITWSTGFQ